MKTILLAGVAIAALTCSAWAAPDRDEEECVGTFRISCTQQVNLDQGNRAFENNNAEAASSGDNVGREPSHDRQDVANAVSERDESRRRGRRCRRQCVRSIVIEGAMRINRARLAVFSEVVCSGSGDLEKQGPLTPTIGPNRSLYARPLGRGIFPYVDRHASTRKCKPRLWYF